MSIKTCDCINKMTEITRKFLKEKAEKETGVAEWKDAGHFENVIFSLTGSDTKIGMPQSA